MRVEDLMSAEVRVCSPDETLQVAARLMWDCDIGCLPVVDGDGRLIGMLTDRDVCMAAFHHDERLSGLRVAEAMTVEVYSVLPSATLEAAEQLMRDGQVRRLPVVDARGELRGLLSLNDLARATAWSNGAGLGALSDPAIVRTLAAIGEAAPPRQDPGSREQAVNLGR
jgi:CBS domain-containing protein